MYKLAVKDSIRDWIGSGYIGSFYDAYSKGARELFWKQMNEKLYSKHFYAWWMDASEPDIESNSSMEYRKKLMNPTASGSSTEFFNAYGLMNAKGIYEGQNVSVNFSLALTRLPAYTQKVLKATAQIPLGYVASYGSIAKAVGGGPRAVGNIMAANPFAPIVPCHRVVKSDFTLGGYGGGLRAKVELLGKEKRGFSSPKGIAVSGRQLMVFPVEYVLRDLD